MKRSSGKAGSGGRSFRGFTLIEILVVISIITILVTVVVAVGAAVRASAQRSQTSATLKTLAGLLDQYRQETGGMDFAYASTGVGATNAVATNQFLKNCWAYPQFAKILTTLNATNQPNTSTVTSVTVSGTQTSNYVAPVVVFTGGGGSGAVATATVTTGKITAITVSSGGSGYTSAPIVTVTDAGGGAGQTFTAVIGAGYTVPDGYGNNIQLVVFNGTGVYNSANPSLSTPPILVPRAPYFQSSGPNGTMGTPTAPDTDDIFSYDP